MKKDRIINTLKMNDRELDKAIKIQGTNYDRKRKVTDEDIKVMQKMYKKGKSLSSIAKVFNVSYNTVQYWVDPVYNLIHRSSGFKHTGKDRISISNRVKYKRDLVAMGAI